MAGVRTRGRGRAFTSLCLLAGLAGALFRAFVSTVVFRPALWARPDLTSACQIARVPATNDTQAASFFPASDPTAWWRWVDELRCPGEVVWRFSGPVEEPVLTIDDSSQHAAQMARSALEAGHSLSSEVDLDGLLGPWRSVLSHPRTFAIKCQAGAGTFGLVVSSAFYPALRSVATGPGAPEPLAVGPQPGWWTQRFANALADSWGYGRGLKYPATEWHRWSALRNGDGVFICWVAPPTAYGPWIAGGGET